MSNTHYTFLGVATETVVQNFRQEKTEWTNTRENILEPVVSWEVQEAKRILVSGIETKSVKITNEAGESYYRYQTMQCIIDHIIDFCLYSPIWKQVVKVRAKDSLSNFKSDGVGEE